MHSCRPASLQGLNGGSKARAASRRAAAAPGQQLTVGSVGGAGRQLEVATGRAVAGTMVGVAARAPLDRAAASSEAQAGRGIDWGTVLLAPAAPLLAALPSRSEGDAAGGNKYDMLLNVLSAAAATPEVQVRRLRAAHAARCARCVLASRCSRGPPAKLPLWQDPAKCCWVNQAVVSAPPLHCRVTLATIRCARCSRQRQPPACLATTLPAAW